MAKRLFAIFGPLVVAALLVGLILLSPINFGFNSVSPQRAREAAVSLSPNVLKGKQIKDTAINEGYVPFFGSSEWSRFDPMHPSVLAAKYHRDYRPFLLGARGTQSLTQYFVMQNMQSQLRNKKAVFCVSPQWFVKDGTRKDAFSFYYSQLQTNEWLSHDRNSAMDRYAAKRLLQMPVAQSDHFVYAALQRVAAGKAITQYQRLYLNLHQNILSQEDRFFSGIGMSAKNLRTVTAQEKALPATDNFQKLDALAGKLGATNTNGNSFRISNAFYNKNLRKGIDHGRYRGFQAHLSYTKSPEFSDFQLVLDQFARLHTNVMFVIPPVNQRWADYTGLSASMLRGFDRKITYQLRSQGFNHIVDLSQKGNVPYFMTDTIHMGWRGWLAMDQQVNPFLSRPQPKPKYHLNNRFYDRQWQQLAPSQLSHYEATN